MSELYDNVILKIYDDLKFYGNGFVKFYDDLKFYGNGFLKFYEDLIPVIGDILGIIPELLISLLKNYSGNEEPDIELPDIPENPSPDPSPQGNDPESDGNDSDKNKKLDKGKGKAKAITPEVIPEDYDSNDYKKLDKGKGKAKATTPELIPEESKEPFTDYDEKIFQNDLEKARLDSLIMDNRGESSKQGAISGQNELEKARLDSLRMDNRGESSKQGASSGQNELVERQKEVELSYDHYSKVSESRRAMAQDFNDITMKLNSKDDNMSPEQREFLLNESIKLKNDVTMYDAYIESLKRVLNIPSEEEGNYPDYSSEESTSEYSSDEDSRPHKRPKK
jgi:hypothetical protein